MAHGTAGRRLRLINVSTSHIVISHEDTRSDAVNRIVNAAGAPVELAEDDVMDLEYDAVSCRWRVVNALKSTVAECVDATLC
jgi:hypothetical protein